MNRQRERRVMGITLTMYLNRKHYAKHNLYSFLSDWYIRHFMDLTVKQVKYQHSAIQTQKTKSKVRRNYCYILTRNSEYSNSVYFKREQRRLEFQFSKLVKNTRQLIKARLLGEFTFRSTWLTTESIITCTQLV